MNDLQVLEAKELQGIETSKAAQIKATFAPMVGMLSEFEGAFHAVMKKEATPNVCAEAKRLRLDIGKIRIAADKARKSQKEEYLRAGNAIQGVFNILKFAVVDKEEKLKEKEEFFERKEAEKIKAIGLAREAELAEFGLDSAGIDLGTMAADVWLRYKQGVKLSWEAEKAAEAQAEKDRADEIERARVYNERLTELTYYKDYVDVRELEQNTSSEQFLAMITTGKAKRAEEEKRREIEQADNARLKAEAEEQEAIMEKQRAELRKAQEEKEAIMEMEREQEKEKLRAAAAPDNEKLIILAERLKMEGSAMTTGKAAQAVHEAVRVLEIAAR